MEVVHDYVQWMFPTDEMSEFNANSPILAPEIQMEFKSDPVLRRELALNFERFCQFLGLEVQRTGTDILVTIGPNFEERKRDCWQPMGFFGNHNWLRVSRVLHCLGLCSMPQEQKAFMACLEEIFAKGLSTCAQSIPHWRKRAGTVPNDSCTCHLPVQVARSWRSTKTDASYEAYMQATDQADELFIAGNKYADHYAKLAAHYNSYSEDENSQISVALKSYYVLVKGAARCLACWPSLQEQLGPPGAQLVAAVGTSWAPQDLKISAKKREEAARAKLVNSWLNPAAQAAKAGNKAVLRRPAPKKAASPADARGGLTDTQEPARDGTPDANEVARATCVAEVERKNANDRGGTVFHLRPVVCGTCLYVLHVVATGISVSDCSWQCDG
ncbi:unnamed protein product [Prorocentrum cordatum]|uniref:Opioid growth factor receptor (OGFr) conserved domain-containing protein n=1 Tax=Prorocentrum cordatum TaxID=2364126 RepID=A0ABN9W145_9DINO|nr:unnamed protein product [Polarella glacialis]